MRYLAFIASVLLFAGPVFGGSKMTTVDVTAFGAIPGDGKDDTAAVAAALEKCPKTGPTTLVFPKGTYDFFAGDSPRTLFSVEDRRMLTIDGRGSLFMIHGVAGLFSFGACSDLAIKDLTIDMDRAPFSMGRVVAVEGNHFDVEVFPEYPVKGGETVGAFMDYDAMTRLPLRHGLDEYYTVEKTELLREQVLRVELKHEARIKPGALALLRHQVYGPCMLYCSRCSDVTVKNVTVHTAPGMGFIGSVCTNITLERFRVMPKPGSGRPMSATADATHFGGCKGTIRLDGCEFEGMGDDGVNIKSGLYLSMKRKVDDHTVLAAHNLKMIDVPDPGDVMEISHVDDLLPYATATVKKAEVGDDKQIRIEFSKPLPQALKDGDVFGNATRTPKVRISDCQVRNNRARGMLIQTRDVVVEGCTFRNCTGPGVLVLTEVTYFFESIGTRNVTVRGNVFENCNYGAAIGPGALCAVAYLKDMAYPPQPGVHKNVIFEGNTISRCDNSAIFVAGVDGITVKGNRVGNACGDPTAPTGSNAIFVMSSRAIRVEGNSVEPGKQASGFKECIAFGENAEKDAAVVRGNKGF